MTQEVSEGHRLDLGTVPGLWEAANPQVTIRVDQTRKSLFLLLTEGRSNQPCYFVTEIKHGTQIMEVRDGTRAELTDFVLVFSRSKNKWGVVTKMWFDQEMPQDEPNATSGVIDSSPAANLPEPPLEPSVAFSPSLELQVKQGK